MKLKGKGHFKLQEDGGSCEVIPHLITFSIPLSKIIQIPSAQINYMTKPFKKKIEVKGAFIEKDTFSASFYDLVKDKDKNVAHLHFLLKAIVNTLDYGKIYYEIVTLMNDDKNKSVVSTDVVEG